MLDRRTSEPWRLKKAGFAGAAADALGDQPGYFDLAIKTALTLGMMFSLQLSPTEAFLTSVEKLIGLDPAGADHAT